MRQAPGQQLTWLDHISVLHARKAAPTPRSGVEFGLGAVLQTSKTPITRGTEVEHEGQTPNAKREAPHEWLDRLSVLHALKTGLTGVLSLFVAQALRLQYPEWAPFTVMVLMMVHPHPGSIALKSLFRVVGTLAGASLRVWLVSDYISSEALHSFLGGTSAPFSLVSSFLSAAYTYQGRPQERENYVR